MSDTPKPTFEDAKTLFESLVPLKEAWELLKECADVVDEGIIKSQLYIALPGYVQSSVDTTITGFDKAVGYLGSFIEGEEKLYEALSEADKAKWDTYIGELSKEPEKTEKQESGPD